MSYILDALKKSEMERSRSAAPSLIGAAEAAPSFRTKLLSMMAIALFANAIALMTWWLWPAEERMPPLATSSADTGVQKVDAMPAPETFATPEQASTVVAPPSSAPKVPPAVEDATLVKSAPVQRPTSINALSDDERRAFVGLEFSSHLYADDPSFRAVTMNGRRLKQGDALTGELVLSEITEEGVVIGFRGRLVELPMLQDWRL